jgi:hypothetical protein
VIGHEVNPQITQIPQIEIICVIRVICG